MPVRLIPNQLVKLYDTETLNQRNKRLTLDYRQYCQIVREGQTTMFQLQLLPDSENLITNGDFQNDISSWNVANPTWRFASGQLQGEKTDFGSPNIEQSFTAVVGKTYVVRGTARFTNLTSSLTIVPNSGLGTVVYAASEYGTTSFEFEAFFVATIVNPVLVFLLSGNIRDLVYIDDVVVYSLSQPTVTLETCNGDFVATIPVFAQSSDYVSYAVDWTERPEGCYRICIDGIDDTQKNYLDRALALGTEGGAPLELEQGGFIKWFG